MGPAELTRRIREAALEEGFHRMAVAPIQELPAAPRLLEWLRHGMHGSMEWIERGAERRADPRQVVPDARSVIILARDYHTGHAAAEAPQKARISRYAWGEDYHRVMGEAVRRVYDRIVQWQPAARGRYYVDTGPVMEKAWAEIAGLGWIGKHTNLISIAHGSWFFLGALLMDTPLEYGRPAQDHCGTCSACIDVCPTGAIVAPYVLDARLCISYLTIEHRGPIPRSLRAQFGNRVFGCDDCQDVCPWNRFALRVDDPEFAPRSGAEAPLLRELMQLSEDDWRARFRHSPIKRAKYAGFLRNVAIGLGNSGDPKSVPVLCARLRDAPPLVRGHCAWALGRLGGEPAARALRRAAADEPKAEVREEIAAALSALAAARGGTAATPVAS